MIAQWLAVEPHPAPMLYRLVLGPFVETASVYPAADGATWRAKVGRLHREGFPDVDAACRWAQDTMRDGLKDALDQLEDLAPEVVNQHKPSREIVITEGG